MPSNFVTRAEDRYVFGISRAVWQIITLVGAAGALVGLAVLTWAVIPPMKKGVRKVAYPPIVQVQSDEILSRLTKPADAETSPARVLPRRTEPEASSYENEEFSVALGHYQNALDSLKGLFPADLYNWDDTYKSVARQDWYGRTSYERVLDKRGVGSQLNDAISELSVTSYDSIALLILGYTGPISLFAVDKRGLSFWWLTLNSRRSVAFTVDNLRALAAAIPHFDANDPAFLGKLANFASRNPRDGRRFIEFASQSADSFEVAIRPAILDKLIFGYYNALDQSLAEQINATAAFMALRGQFSADQQVNALGEFYSLYKEKNSQRRWAIERIERDYALAQAEAEAKYQADKVQKLQLRLKGIKALGLGIGLVAIIAILLALLSIQRSVRKLEQRVAAEQEETVHVRKKAAITVVEAVPEVG